MSLIVMTGKFIPSVLLVVGSMLSGPYEPMHPPITFAHITKNFFVSIAFPGPTACDHHPLLFVIGLVPLTNWSPVRA